MLVPTRPRRSRALLVVLLTLGVVLAGSWVWFVAHLALTGGEWQCSQGEVPAGPDGVYSQCRKEGSTLPKGWAFDPMGNRPLAYNCDGPRWVEIERPASSVGPDDSHQDCIRRGTPVPAGWHVGSDG